MDNKLIDKISNSAKKYTQAHFDKPDRNDYFLIENAMLLGAAITLHDLSEIQSSELNDFTQELLNLDPELIQ